MVDESLRPSFDPAFDRAAYPAFRPPLNFWRNLCHHESVLPAETNTEVSGDGGQLSMNGSVLRSVTEHLRADTQRPSRDTSTLPNQLAPFTGFANC